MAQFGVDLGQIADPAERLRQLSPRGRDAHAMTNVTTKSDSFQPATDTAAHLFDNWFDPIEIGVRERVREFIEALIRGELDAVLARPRYGRAKNDDACPAGIVGHRHGSRTRSLTGSFGKTEITVPRARLQTSEGGTTE
jgi:hypothetical protein